MRSSLLCARLAVLTLLVVVVSILVLLEPATGFWAGTGAWLLTLFDNQLKLTNATVVTFMVVFVGIALYSVRGQCRYDDND